MKKCLLLALLFWGTNVGLSSDAAAQERDKLPTFTMTLSNGQFFTADQIPKGKPVILIYFAPDCDHCHTLMNAFFKRANDFKTAEVLMVTFKPVADVQAFERSYRTAQYSNIKVGTEGTTYYLRNFYRLQNTPFTALYNKQGKLVTSYRKDTPLDDVQKQLKKMSSR